MLSIPCFHCGVCRGAADNDEEAHARADVLQQAGVILRFNGVVYLRPEEIAEIVYRVSHSIVYSSLLYHTRQGSIEPAVKHAAQQLVAFLAASTSLLSWVCHPKEGR
jgi:hypothetical protein